MCNRPAIASTSAPVRITPSIGEERSPRLGWRIACAWICWRRSGEALIRNQRSPSPLTASDAWVRAVTPGAPSRARRHATAFEFHWGKPPPAAAPRTTALIATVLEEDYPAGRGTRRLQVGAGVGVDLHADGNLDNTRGFPSHGRSPLKWRVNDVGEPNRLSRLGRQVSRNRLNILIAQGN